MSIQLTDTTRSFALFQLHAEGKSIALREPLRASYGPLDVMRGFEIVESTDDPETGIPDWNKVIWFALVQAAIMTGELNLLSITTDVIDHGSSRPNSWKFRYQFEGYLEGAEPFLSIRHVTGEANDYKPNASVEPREVDPPSNTAASVHAKTLGYMGSVFPGLSERSPAALPYFIIETLRGAGLPVTHIWVPRDTSKHYARFYLSNGIDKMVIDVNGPELLRNLKVIDRDIAGLSLGESSVLEESDWPEGEAVKSAEMEEVPENEEGIFDPVLAAATAHPSFSEDLG